MIQTASKGIFNGVDSASYKLLASTNILLFPKDNKNCKIFLSETHCHIIVTEMPDPYVHEKICILARLDLITTRLTCYTT